MRTKLEVTPLNGYPPEIGTWLWAMEATRQRTLRLVHGLPQDALDWAGPDGTENGIGTLLYHLAAVEMGWLCLDVLGRPDLYPEDDLPFEPFAEGRITAVVGVPLGEHVARLDRTRALFLARMRETTQEDWARLREPEGEDYAVTPAWVVFHLVEHEAGHAAQIAVLKKRARAALA